MKLLGLSCIFLVVLSADSARGLVIQEKSLKEIVELCTDVCVGTVGRLEVEEDPLTGMIYTLAEVTVEECLLGVVQDRDLMVKTPGGEVGDVGLFVPGMPIFEEGEGVLVLLIDDGQGSYRVISGALGEYSITEDPLTGEKIATNSVEGIRMMDERLGEGGAYVVEPLPEEGTLEGPLPGRMPLDDLLNLIHEANSKANWR